jgi:IS1 family transposase
MEKLSVEKRAMVLKCLVECSSVASVVRITGTAKMTVLKILRECGEACCAYMDEKMVNLPCKTIQLDEIWSFVGCKEGHKERHGIPTGGDAWMWTAICSDTKLIPSWFIGDRGGNSAYAFCADLSKRFAGRVQITSDGWQAYEWAIRANFGEDNVDYAQMVKQYTKSKSGRNYVTGIEKRRVYGNPDMAKVSTSHVERSNLTLRMNNKRFARLTPCHSKRIENHAHAVAITMMHYNFCRRHESLKKSPAMAASIADHVWTLEEVVEMVNAYHEQKLATAYESAFEAHYQTQRAGRVVVDAVRRNPPPLRHLTPWYLDPESGGPNPEIRKEGIAYDP